MSSPPTTLGQYQIIREIARSNDIVYEAYDPLMNRRVAVKELSMPGGTTGPQREERINRFKREAQAAGTLNHPNIMTVFSFAEDSGRTFMAMEYLDGCTLRNEIDTKGTLSTARAIEIALELLHGLEHAHSKGVIHRDIKPDNIQILSGGQIKITDFGIARLTFQPNLTMDGQVFGTPSYMSPEQVVGKDIDARSDLFSVGVVLYEMIAGKKPFTGDSVVAITYGIMNKEADQPPAIHYALWQVIQKSLEKTPGLRFSSAAEMTKALVGSERALNSQNMVLDPQAGYGTNPYTGQYSAGGPQALPQMPSPPPVYGYNPYLSAQPPPVVAPPLSMPVAFGVPQTAPYNPGGAQSYGQMAPPVPGYSPPQGQSVPIYYPPPPHAPLFKPETIGFLKSLATTIVILGTLFMLVIVATDSCSRTLQNINAERQDQQISKRVSAGNQAVPVEDRINEAEAQRAKLQSASRQSEEDRNIAALREEEGKGYLSVSDYIHAEKSFSAAAELDPHNPAYFTDLADLYSKQAQNEQDPLQRADLWKKSAQTWQVAASEEPDATRNKQYKEATATMYYYYASDVARSGDMTQKSEARSALYEARDNASANSALGPRIQQLLATLR